MALLTLLPKQIVALKERRGVAGLISVIAIVLVFGLAATAFFQLNSHQASLISSTSRTIDVQGKKAAEQLQFKIFNCVLQPDGKTRTIIVKVNSTWSERSVLDSAIFIKPDGDVTNSVYVIHANKTIHSMANDVSIKVNATDTKIDSTTISVKNATQAIFVTELGKKFSLLHDFKTTCVGG